MKRFKNILCVLNIEKTHKFALERAVTLAENNQASLTVVITAEPVTLGFGMPEGGPVSANLQAIMVSAKTQKLETTVAPYRARVEIQTRLLIGIPYLEIIRDVLHNRRDLVIKVPEPQDWLDRLFGSEDIRLLRKCPCPIWLMKPTAPKTYRCILAAVDVDDTPLRTGQEPRGQLNRQILELAISMALADFAELHIVHAWEVIGEGLLRSALMRMPEEKIRAYVEQERQQREASLNGLLQEFTSNLGPDVISYLKPRTHLVKGWAREEIPVLTKRIEADLVVMGTVVRTGVPGFFMGNTAEAILNQIECSVLALKPAGFITPVTLVE